MTTPDTTAHTPPADTDQIFGYHLRIQLGRCDLDKVREGYEVLSWSQRLTSPDGIDMKAHGEPWLDHFGPEPGKIGWTLFYPITTSNLFAWVHANDTGTGFFDVFSCEWFEPAGAAELTRQFFGAKDITWDFTVRRVPAEGA